MAGTDEPRLITDDPVMVCEAAFSESLADRMERDGITPEYLAELSGLAVETVTTIALRQRQPTRQQAWQISHCLITAPWHVAEFADACAIDHSHAIEEVRRQFETDPELRADLERWPEMSDEELLRDSTPIDPADYPGWNKPFEPGSYVADRAAAHAARDAGQDLDYYQRLVLWIERLKD